MGLTKNIALISAWWQVTYQGIASVHMCGIREYRRRTSSLSIGLLGIIASVHKCGIRENRRQTSSPSIGL